MRRLWREVRMLASTILLDWVQRWWPAETDGDRAVHAAICILLDAMDAADARP